MPKVPRTSLSNAKAQPAAAVQQRRSSRQIQQQDAVEAGTTSRALSHENAIILPTVSHKRAASPSASQPRNAKKAK
ncbi:hypothetical protein H0H81_007374, partial [Sphagnurus paluster]